MFEAMMVYMNHCQNLPVVYSSTIQLKSNALRGHKITPCLEERSYAQKYFGSIQRLPMQALFSPDDKKVENPTEFNTALWNKICQKNSDKCDRIILYSCACMIKQEKQKKVYSALYLLAYLLQRYVLPLKLRRQVINENGHRRLFMWILNVCVHVEQALCHSFSQDNSKDKNVTEEIKMKTGSIIQKTEDINARTNEINITDLVDGPLLHYLAQFKAHIKCAQGLGLEKKHMDRLESLWKTLCESIGYSSKLFPILETDELNTRKPYEDDVEDALD
eukprot:UN29987